MTAENVLGNEHRPRFFAVGNTAELDLPVAEPRYDVALRTYVRSLAGMQKEALVVSSATDLAWRLVSDEGPYLAGHDEAPFPLAFMAAGMVASYYTEAAALAAKRGVGLAGVHLTLDNYYTASRAAACCSSHGRWWCRPLASRSNVIASVVSPTRAAAWSPVW
jgi:hypothetical protein